LGGRAGGLQGNYLGWPRTRESWLKREIGLQDLIGASERHCGELFAATRAGGEMKLVSGGFIGA
jgi:hypothetical protein